MPYLLVQRSLTPPEIEPVQRAFQTTGIFHALDAVSFVKDAFGVLAKGLNDYQAQQLQNALAVQGVEVEVVEETEWPTLPAAKRIVRASCWAEGFAPWDPLGRELHVPWDQVVVVSAGMVQEVEFGKRVTASLTTGMTRFDNGDDVKLTNELTFKGEERNWRWAAEVILAGGLRFIWQAHEFNYTHLGDRVSRDPAANFALFLRDLLSAVPHAALNRGAFALRENQPATAPRYPTRNAFAEETAWLLWRLRQVGRYAPPAIA
jgi:hypothetical protein